MKISTTLAFTAVAVLASVGVLSADQYNGRYSGNYYNGRTHNNDCGCSTCRPACEKPVCCQPTAPTCCKPYRMTCPTAPCAEPVKKCCGPQTRWECPKTCCSCNGNHSSYSYDGVRDYRVQYIDTTYSMDAHNQRAHGQRPTTAQPQQAQPANGQPVAFADQKSYGQTNSSYAQPNSSSFAQPVSSFAQPSATAATDDFIMQTIRTALQGDRSLSNAARNIKINVSNGVVTLSGTVANDAEKARIESIAQVSGVTSVLNQINVQ